MSIQSLRGIALLLGFATMIAGPARAVDLKGEIAPTGKLRVAIGGQQQVVHERDRQHTHHDSGTAVHCDFKHMKRIVDLHGGTVVAETTGPSGTTFKIAIPSS